VIANGDKSVNFKLFRSLRTTRRHLPYRITQCYLPPDTSELTPSNHSNRLTPARQAGTRFT